MMRYYPSIQIFRGILFLLILAFHCGVPYANLGWGGVEAFFVISAFFLVRKQWGSKTLDVSKQFKHRIIRLYPPYIAVLIVAALYALLMKAIPYDLVIHLLFAQNYQWMITGYSSVIQPITAHTWTLSIEVWSGLIWLLLLHSLTKQYFKFAMYGMFVIGILYRILTIGFGANVWIVSLCPLAHFDAFACGSLLAIDVRENKLNKKIGLLSIIGITGIVSCIGMIAINNNISFSQGYLLLSTSKNYLNNFFTGNIYIFISLLATGILGLLFLKDKKSTRDLIGIEKWFIKLGNYSYILYLFHWPILVVLKKLVSSWKITFPAVLATSIVIAFTFNKMYVIVQKKLSGGK